MEGAVGVSAVKGKGACARQVEIVFSGIFATDEEKLGAFRGFLRSIGAKPEIEYQESSAGYRMHVDLDPRCADWQRRQIVDYVEPWRQ